jgi:type IV pilus assembly protein PilA
MHINKYGFKKPTYPLRIRSVDKSHYKRIPRHLLKAYKPRTYARGGFTLIEVLVVIGIIAILAAVVLVAVNPSRQFKLARDSQRTSNVNAILNAIHQNMSEHKGSFVCNGVAKTVPVTFTRIKSSSSPADPGDIASCLVPDYLSALPFDPSITDGHFASTTDYDTGYEYARDTNGRITASSTGELTTTISVTR